MQNNRAGKIEFPWSGKFEAKTDLIFYFDDEKLTCLLCGKRYIQLVAHLIPSHEVTADEYKQRYGIPWTYGLAGKTFKTNSSLRIKSTRQSGTMSARPSAAHIDKLVKAAKERRGNVTSVSKDNRDKLLTLHGQPRQWGMGEFETYLKRIGAGRTPSEVASDRDLPTLKWFYEFMRRNEKCRKRFGEVWDSVSYSVHARAHKLGTRFSRDVMRLRRRGLLWKVIADERGVAESAVRNRWHQLKLSRKLTKNDLKPRPNKHGDAVYRKFLEDFAKGKTLRDIALKPNMPSVAQFYRYLAEHPKLRAQYAKIGKARQTRHGGNRS